MFNGRFMSSRFEPKIVFLQIICVEALFNLIFVSSTLFVDVLFGLKFGLSKFFDPSHYSFENAENSTLCFMLWISLGLVAFSLPRIIERTRKCLDFVLTICCLHIFISWVFFQFPSKFSWWLVWTLGATGCTLLAEYLCMLEERREIQLGGSTSPRSGGVELGGL